MIAGDIGVFTGADGNDLFHHIGDGGSGLFGNDLTLHSRRGLINHVAVAVEFRVNHIRLHQLAAIGNRIDRGNHLNGAYLERLTERTGGKLGNAHAFQRVISLSGDRFCLGGQIDAGFFGKTECLKIFVKAFFAERLTDGDKKRVAGIH